MYSARITRENRTAFIILCDRSGSMTEEVVLRETRMRKCDAVALIINMLIDELINRCRREDGIRDYFDLCVLEYSGDGVISLLSESIDFTTVAELTRRPVETRKHHILRRLPGGNQISASIDQKWWIEAKASGNTPMGSALAETEAIIRKWCSAPENRKSFPPIVINITDGEASDVDCVDLEAIAEKIKSISTLDGNVLLFNIHICTSDDYLNEVTFPNDVCRLPNHRYAKTLYGMSSCMPECYNNIIINSSDSADMTPPFRAMSYNCPIDELFSILTIGTVSSSFTL